MIRLIKLIIWILIITWGIFYWNYSGFENRILRQEEQEIEIKWGSTFRSALIDAGAGELMTKIYLSQNTPSFQLQKGKFLIPAKASVKEYIESLENPIPENDEELTFLEGWNIYDIDSTLTKAGYISFGDFSSYASNIDTVKSLKEEYDFLGAATTLEGYLYPDTYAVNPNTFTKEGFAKKMLDRFNEKVMKTGILDDMSLEEIQATINLASIVQKEANKKDNPEEVAIIAGILKKRDDEWWMIGADATVCYPHKLPTESCTPDKVLEHLYDENPYNTRKVQGLPPTPIVNPEADIIKASRNTVATDYYFYLHGSDGQIRYAITNAEHEWNKARYMR